MSFERVDLSKQEEELPKLEVPYFEDSKEQEIPGRGTTKDLEALQDEVAKHLRTLGARGIRFFLGQDKSKPRRWGYEIEFELNGIPGRINILALPLRNETEVKRDRALAQALYLFRNQLESEVFSRIYRPGAVALLPYLVGNDGLTVMDSMTRFFKLSENGGYFLPSSGGGNHHG